jgi:uncharacterized iron-regulated membrane protein
MGVRCLKIRHPTTSAHHRPLKTSLQRFLRHWHARIGLAAALFFFFLVVSGIALNHTDALRLSERHLSAPWLTSWYGLRAQTPTQGYELGTQFLTWDAQRWALDTRVIASDAGTPIGAVRTGEVIYIATRDALALHTPAGQLIDKVSGAGLPAPALSALGTQDARIVVRGAQGNFASEDGVEWTPFNAQAAWSAPRALPDSLASALRATYAPSIDSERVLLDLHSGRLFGRYGPIVIDIVALGLLALAVSGVWMYVRAVRMQKARERR